VHWKELENVKTPLIKLNVFDQKHETCLVVRY